MRLAGLAIALLAGSAGMAQPSNPSQILVSASGLSKTAPDMVTVGFTLRGEGTSSDGAVAQLRDGAAKVSAGVNGLIGKAGTFHSSNFSVAQVRSKDCDQNTYGQQRLSTGPCAIIGYIAAMPVTVDTARVSDAGTLTGLISRLGGVDVGIRSFWLQDERAARRAAMQAALANAHEQARQIAEGAGAKLGTLLRVQDADYREVSMEMPAAVEVSAPAAPPPPPPPPPPIRIDLAPEPIQTTVRLMVAYGIGG